MHERESQLTIVSLEKSQTKFNNDIFISELIVAVGSSGKHKRTELLNVNENNWSEAEDYPFDWGLT